MGSLRRPVRLVVWLGAFALLAACGSSGDPGSSMAPTTSATTIEGDHDDQAPEEEPTSFIRVDGVFTTEDYESGSGLERWFQELPQVQDVRIPSSVDGHEQPALWLPPPPQQVTAGPQPLLVVLHSWSNDYDQHNGIVFGRWAQANGWAMIHPHFRGVFEQPEATGSDLAVSDVVDAIDYAVEHDDIDEERVFVLGYSGGGMMSLLMAGRHPELFAGAAAWVPIYDLVDWYEHNAEGQTRYVPQIATSCGGDPLVDEGARAECEHRSPRQHLASAAGAGLPVYIGAGIADDNVPPHHAALSFNALAAEPDRLSDEQVAVIRQGQLPEELAGAVEAQSYFTEGEPAVLFSRSSGPVALVLFDGGHEMAFHPALEWMTQLTDR